MDYNNCYIITGASKGLGKALSDLLKVDKNNLVIGIARSPLKSGANFTGISLDLGNTDQLMDKMDEILPEGPFKKVVLVNNAGWIGEIAHTGYLAPTSIRDIYQVNVIAPALLMNAFMKKYDHHPGEKMIINVSSGAAGKVTDGWSGYSASKAALNQMTAVAQQESDLKNRGFRLFALSPGIIDTPMQETIRSAPEESFSSLSKFKTFKSEGALSTPEAIAKKVVYLITNHWEFSGVLQDVRNF
ncbi:SDR family NAD(P)-dependent oxidoreductase [Cyclobacterium sp.]|uniref:SDR family NAD(P)-dependent oxidoreductase n=1 Tax=Cyclobacterium sp. TaxID=1966343 RepID=UPI0019B4961A|nr:SDR family NAD(P)-dependent oxidoreductase [Cyclobacterium sp.]MBD3628613.1 SDR family NAD(P)-dependent oxidoreductase [Cyclobacterium sp.]